MLGPLGGKETERRLDAAHIVRAPPEYPGDCCLPDADKTEYHVDEQFRLFKDGLL